MSPLAPSVGPPGAPAWNLIPVTFRASDVPLSFS